jgi:hypothetical protein
MMQQWNSTTEPASPSDVVEIENDKRELTNVSR